MEGKCAGCWVWQDQATHVIASQFSSQTGGEDLASPPQFRLEIKSLSALSHWLEWHRRNFFGDWAYAWYRVTTCVVQSWKAECYRIIKRLDPVPFYISYVSMVTSVLGSVTVLVDCSWWRRSKEYDLFFKNMDASISSSKKENEEENESKEQQSFTNQSTNQITLSWPKYLIAKSTNKTEPIQAEISLKRLTCIISFNL